MASLSLRAEAGREHVGCSRRQRNRKGGAARHTPADVRPDWSPHTNKPASMNRLERIGGFHGRVRRGLAHHWAAAGVLTVRY
jgi:hypothetical protein